MKNIHRIVCTFWVLCLLAACVAQRAHALPATVQRADMFNVLFPNPSNNNGYEEFVRAAEMIQSMPELATVSHPSATLADKRRVLAMPRIAQALSLVREGLAKRVTSPRSSVDENTLFPEYAMFRALARLLEAEEYVNFADGDIDAAIDSLKTGLSFAYRVQMDTLIAGLVGVAMEAIVIKGCADHVESLSVFQCDRVVALMKEFLAAQKPGSRLLESEKSQIISMLENRRSNADGLIELLTGPKPSPQELNDMESLKSSVASNPGILSPAISKAQALVAAMYDQAANSLTLPVAHYNVHAKNDASSPADIIFRSITVNPDHILNKYYQSDAMYRLLAVHALIRRYRWDHNALPASLDELRADDLIVDPFTGDRLIYKPDKDRYDLFSAGPNNLDDATGEPTGSRTPVRL